jgi:hypothetical protein
LDINQSVSTYFLKQKFFIKKVAMKITYTSLLVLLTIFYCNISYCQSDHTNETHIGQNIRNSYETRKYDNSSTELPEQLILKPSKDIEIIKHQGPFISDWNSPDIKVDSGTIATAGFRQAVIKFGSDYNMYAVVNKKAISGQFNGKINIFKSEDGGLSWMQISTIQSFSSFIGQFSFTIENNTPANPDSTRIIVFYTLSTSQNLTSSVLNFFSVKRDGSAPVQGNILVATSGFKLFNPSSISSSIYGGPQSGFGVVIGEYNNTTDATRSLRYLRTTNFGSTFESVSLIDPGYPTFDDYFPSASFKKGTTDSVYIAVERRLATDTLTRIIVTPWAPTASATTNFLTSGPDNYERPSLSILQTNPAQQIMVTTVKNLGRPVYHYSTDGGTSWVIDAQLDTTGNRVDIKFIECSSDPDITGGGYFIVGFQDAFFSTSDSITLRRGVLGNLGPYNYKVNNASPTGFIGPSVAIYKYTPGGGTVQKRSAFMYVGSGTVNALYNQENLPTGIINNNGIANNFKLSQNYPNPFNPTTKIDFEIPLSSSVKLAVYDMLGREVKTLINENLNSGVYTVDFKGDNLTSGIYFYRISVINNSGKYQDVKKMMLIK